MMNAMKFSRRNFLDSDPNEIYAPQRRRSKRATGSSRLSSSSNFVETIREEEAMPPPQRLSTGTSRRQQYRTSAFNQRASVVVHRSVTEALEDPQSELNAFLDTDAKPLNTSKAWFYSLILEPNEVRRERIIMLSEAYAVFGALFLNGIWFVYEYGNSTEFDNPALERIFNLFSALGIMCNVFMAMFSGFLWMMSIIYSGSHSNWVYGCRHFLVYLFHLVIGILFTTTVLVAIGVYNSLKTELPEMILSTCFLAFICYEGMYQTSILVATQIPLEFHHFPLWVRYIVLPFPYFNRDLAQRIPEDAKERAGFLKARADMEHTLDEHMSSSGDHAPDDLEILLENAATAIGKPNLNVVPFLLRLRHELYDDVASLEGEEVETLAQCMPLRLAKEVHRHLNEKMEVVTA